MLLALGLVFVDRSAFTLNDESTTSLQIANLGCRQWVPLWLEAQAVPSATLMPCIRSLPSGWQFARADVKNGTAQYLVNHDRAGDNALTARLTRHCDTRDAREVTSGDARIRRFQRPAVDGTQTWYDIFPGGCVTVIVHSVTSRTEVTFSSPWRRPSSLDTPTARRCNRHSPTAPTVTLTSTPPVLGRPWRMRVDSSSRLIPLTRAICDLELGMNRNVPHASPKTGTRPVRRGWHADCRGPG